jgi:hypothetical protein
MGDGQEPRKIQIVVGYEGQPYLKLDFTMDDVLRAMVSAFPTIPTHDEFCAWLVAAHMNLREKIANVLDYGFEDENKSIIFRDILIVAEQRLQDENHSLANFKSVILNYRAGQNPKVPELPSFYITGNPEETISNEAFVARSTTRYVYEQHPDGRIEQLKTVSK